MRPTEEQPHIVHILYCYATVKEDERWKNKLKDQFTNLRQQNLINDWCLQDIKAGQDRKEEVERRLETAHIILLLISPDFIVSDYWYGIMRRAIERRGRGEAKVFFILLRPTHITDAPFSHLDILPAGGRSIQSSNNKEQVCADIVNAISPTIYEILGMPGPLDEAFEQLGLMDNSPPGGRNVRPSPPPSSNERTGSKPRGRAPIQPINNGQTRNRSGGNAPAQNPGGRQGRNRPNGRTTLNRTTNAMHVVRPLPGYINKNFFWEDIRAIIRNIKYPGLGTIYWQLISKRSFNNRYRRGRLLAWVFFLIFDVGFVSLGISLWVDSTSLTMSCFFLLLFLFILISKNRHLLFNMTLSLIFSVAWLVIGTHYFSYLSRFASIGIFCICAFFFAMRIILFTSTR